MLVTNFVNCTTCGNEIQVTTDGRVLEARATLAAYQEIAWAEARDSIFYFPCPVIESMLEKTCTGQLTWTGEGAVLNDRELYGPGIKY